MFLEFLIRLPAGRTLFKELITVDVRGIESPKYAVRYGERGLFIKQKEIYEKEIVIGELTRRQKDIIEILEIMVPKTLGI